MSNDQHRDGNDKWPNLARVFMVDGQHGEMGPAIYILEVGSELPELLIAAMDQLVAQEVSLTVGHLSAALIFRAVSTGNRVSVRSAPMNANYPMQFNALMNPNEALGGIGTVILDVLTGVVVTYGGRGFPEIAASNPYMPCEFHFEQFHKMPASGVLPGQEAPTTRTRAEKPEELTAKQKSTAKGMATRARNKKAKEDAAGNIEV